MDAPLVSIVIPVFNGLPFLPQAISSVARQEFPNIEIVIMDAGSTDGSIQWLHDSGHEYVEDLPAQNAAETWTHVTERANGKFIMLLCQDDVLYPGAIAMHVDALLKFPTAVASIAQRDIIDARSRTIWRNRGLGTLKSGPQSGLALLRESFLRGTNVIGEPHCLLFRRDSLMNAMPWDGSLPYLLDLATYTKVLVTPGTTVVAHRTSAGAFRVSAHSWSTRLESLQREQMQLWQRAFAQAQGVSDSELRRALSASQRQAWVRGLVYRYLKLTQRLSPA